jgi:hypothetical protein
MAVKLVIGELYSRDDVAEIVGLPPGRRKGGDWATGYRQRRVYGRSQPCGLPARWTQKPSSKVHS